MKNKNARRVPFRSTERILGFTLDLTFTDSEKGIPPDSILHPSCGFFVDNNNQMKHNRENHGGDKA
jgi:hypothetical protein